MLYFFIRCCLFSFLYALFLHSLLLVLCCLFSFLYSIFFFHSMLLILGYSFSISSFLVVCSLFSLFRYFLLLTPVSSFSISSFVVACYLSFSLFSEFPITYSRFFILYFSILCCLFSIPCSCFLITCCLSPFLYTLLLTSIFLFSIASHFFTTLFLYSTAFIPIILLTICISHLKLKPCC